MSKRPDLRGTLLYYDDNGECIGFKKDKDIPPEVRAARDRMLAEDADRARVEYLARLSAHSDEPLIVLRIQDEELAKMVKEGLATAEDFNTWRRATSSGLVPLLYADVATALYDRVTARMQKGVDRTICPEGMTDLEHALLVAENCGSKGSPPSAPMADRLQVAALDWWRRNPKLSARAVAENLARGEKANGRNVTPGIFGSAETIRKAIKKPISG